jgi:acetyl esterase/lipase
MTAEGMTRRAFALFAGGGALALASCARQGPARAMAGSAPPAPPAAFDITPYVDPELRPLVPRLQQMTQMMARMQAPGPGQGSGQMPATMPRPMMSPGQPLPKPAWSERAIPGGAGAPDVHIYVINADAHGAPRPAILHMHGGGYVAGTAKSSIMRLQQMALALDCVIVTVEYRLAPATHFPGSLEDNYAGLSWLYRNAGALGVDRARIAVMGESAGGGHAAMLAIAARDRGEVPLLFQALVYPMLDDRTGSTHKVDPPVGQLVWTPERNVYGWTSLLGVPAGSRQVPAGAVPARVENLKGLPPAFIGVGSIDLFVDEDIDYARRLIALGIPVELNVVPGAFHAFDGMAPDTDIAKRFKAALTGALMRAFKPKA